MKNVYITFGGAAFDGTTKLIVERARDFGADEVRVYDDRWLMQTDFYRANRWIFDRQPKMGFGWCSWKAWLIDVEMRRPGADVVLYTDADTYPIADLRGVFNAARRDGIILFEEQGCIHRQWTRADCWRAMGREPKPEEVLACGRFVALSRSWDYCSSFLALWDRYSLERRCQFHEAGGAEDHEVIRHSAEQSVLGIIAVDWNIPRHRCPDQAGWPVAHNGTYKPDDDYPQLFIQDGRRGNTSDLSGSRYRNI